jgi:hypothetical protein
MASGRDNARSALANIRVTGIGGLVSSRLMPDVAPGVISRTRAAIVNVNGKKVVEQQVATVEYLSDNDKLQLPKGLLEADGATVSNALSDARKIYKTIVGLQGLATVLPAETYTLVIDTADDTLYRGRPSEWKVHEAAAAPAVRTDVKLVTSFGVGDWDENDDFVDIADNEEERVACLKVKWGADDNDELYVLANVERGENGPADFAEFLEMSGVDDQLKDFASAEAGLNYSFGDRGFLLDEGNRWKDIDCQTRQSLERYTPKLTSYSMTMVAALNLNALNGHAMLAWSRAYGVAMGLLPHPGSLHHTEYQVTEFLPSEVELDGATNDHPEGEAGQKYGRGCWSLIAAFGSLHLALDHTYKPSDESLLRKAKVMIKACRTTLAEGLAETLSADNALKVSIRTMAHPFGLSSTWGAFLDGQALRTIAEPLQIRTSTVPPPMAKVGLCVSQLTKILALPIGKILAETYGDTLKGLVVLKATVVAASAAYSALHKHYGYSVQRTLTGAETDTLNSLLPIVASYALVFDVDADGNATGALLSIIIEKCLKDQNGLCTMYSTAFTRYVETATDLVSLVAGRTATPAAPAAVAAAPTRRQIGN